MSNGVFSGQLCSQEDFKHLVCWWVELCSHSVGCLAWGIPAPEPTGCWVGLGLSEKMATSRRAHANEYSLELPLPVSPSLQWATNDPSSPQDTFQYQQVRLAHVLMRSLLFSLGLDAHKTLCAPSKSGVSFSQSPVKFLWSNPSGLQARFSGRYSSHWQPPQAGTPDLVLRTFTPVEEILWYIYFPVCG